MNKLLLENNNTFILEKREPKKSLTTFIYVPESYKFPTSQETSDILDKIYEVSDIVLLFQKKPSEISLKKFSSLYRSLGYVVTSQNSSLYLQLYSLIYFKEVFNGIGFAILDIRDLESLDIDQLYSMMISQVSSSVYQHRRMTASELSEIYLQPKDKISYFSWLGIKSKETAEGLYSRRKVISDVLFFRPNLISWISDFIDAEDAPPMFLESFEERDPKEFFGSIIEYLPDDIKVLNLPYEEVKL